MTKHKPHIVKKWLRVFESIDNSKLSTIEYCRQNNISVKTLYTWRSKLRKVKLSPANDNNHFQEVKLKEPPFKPLSLSKQSDSINIFINTIISSYTFCRLPKSN
ncbi:MAG TPA: hypothetical protein QF753_20240 [Victivallales bacterium]|nr:hypothetical protein [Victivallales bacterium]